MKDRQITMAELLGAPIKVEVKDHRGSLWYYCIECGMLVRCWSHESKRDIYRVDECSRCNRVIDYEEEE